VLFTSAANTFQLLAKFAQFEEIPDGHPFSIDHRANKVLGRISADPRSKKAVLIEEESLSFR
jgi:hypothetical protein